MFDEYRRKRMAEMKKDEKRGRRFGSMEGLGREDFVREVTEGSRVEVDDEGIVRPREEVEEDGDEDEEGEGESRNTGRLRGTGVVVFLFKDSYVSHPLAPLMTPIHPSAYCIHQSYVFGYILIVLTESPSHNTFAPSYPA
jgi:hypothetical protein